jgi:CO/xanthine dehydrogenase Mo-binding subunit
MDVYGASKPSSNSTAARNLNQRLRSRNRCGLAAGPYRVDYVDSEGVAARTNNPPCGAMRGFGAVQACLGYEAQMDALAKKLDMHPVELRLQNALQGGDPLPVTGQRYAGRFPFRPFWRQ